MPAKRTTDPKILDDPAARFMLLVEGVMAEVMPQFERLDPPVTYHTYFGDFSGGPGMTIWFGFTDRAAKDRAQSSGLTARVRSETEAALVRHGYPKESITTDLFLDFTSQEEIEAGGGEFYFFR
jgi:hypothetical protein